MDLVLELGVARLVEQDLEVASGRVVRELRYALGEEAYREIVEAEIIVNGGRRGGGGGGKGGEGEEYEEEREEKMWESEGKCGKVRENEGFWGRKRMTHA